MRKKTSKPVLEGPEAPESSKGRINAYEWIECLCAALIFCVFFFLFVLRIIDVKGTSMNPTLQDGDKMVVSAIGYEPEAGDVVVFKKDEYDANKALVKRIIATEGQEVNIDFDTGEIFIDGELIDEPYISELTRNKLDFIGPKTVPEGCVFVMGDNRNKSVDSRKTEIGMVDTRLILGKVYAVIFPLNDVQIMY